MICVYTGLLKCTGLRIYSNIRKLFDFLQDELFLFKNGNIANTTGEKLSVIKQGKTPSLTKKRLIVGVLNNIILAKSISLLFIKDQNNTYNG